MDKISYKIWSHMVQFLNKLYAYNHDGHLIGQEGWFSSFKFYSYMHAWCELLDHTTMSQKKRNDKILFPRRKNKKNNKTK